MAGRPRLIILNGPPGCGKSTLARRYAGAHPLTLNLDIDRIRALIGQWDQHPQASGQLARAASLAAADAHLAAGHEVIIPQYLGRPEFLVRAEELAAAAGAEFREIVLMDSKENVLRGFSERSAAGASSAHLEAERLLADSGGPAELAAMYDRLILLLGGRPRAVVLPVVRGEEDRAYEELVACLLPPSG